MKFVMIYGPSGIGKESIARALAKRKDWKVFPQHLAFDLSSAVIGFGNNGFERYQRNVCLEAFETIVKNGASGIVFTFCYVSPNSDYFISGLLDFISKYNISPSFICLKCELEEHIRRVTSESRKNTNKIQSKEYLLNYLERFDFAATIPGVSSKTLDTTDLSIQESATEIEKNINT
ncbi:AAA family ATPase [Microbulbifer sp. GL-2]|uniref:AAA family ATPase n=1 Tax=Microbulbifer sp. GL-2 TaxID=2591606 RepID=UPI0011620498|nr:AAA family ATPase [Microbulbifer sp. GL-2]BBM02975.1 hypothetical protein GL2_30490 [Microbulbifer sp. GL-2]